MNYKYLWANGNLELAPAFGKIHHWQLLKKMIDEGKLINEMPDNYVGGTYSQDPFHDNATVTVDWQGGSYPNPDELKYLIGRELESYGRESSVRNRVQALVDTNVDEWDTDEYNDLMGDTPDETYGESGEYRGPRADDWSGTFKAVSQYIFSFFYLGHPVNELCCNGVSYHYDLMQRNGNRIYQAINDGTLIVAGQVHSGDPNNIEWVSDWVDSEYENEDEEYGEHSNGESRKFFRQNQKGKAQRALLARWPRKPNYVSKVSATVEDTEPQYNMDFLKDPQKELYPCAWEGKDMKPDAKKALKAHVLNEIEKEFRNPDKWIYFTVYGSGASYNWSEEGDFDVQMWVDFAKFMELTGAEIDQDELLANVRRIVQAVNFPSFKDLNLQTEDCSGDMLIQFYPKPGTGAKEENLAQRPYACYDMETDEWIVPPHPIKPKFYGESFLLLRPKAEDIAVQSEALMDELERHTVDWQFWYAMYNKYHNPEYRDQFELSRAKAEEEKEGVKNLFDNVFKGRQEAYTEGGKGYLDERDLLQKLLEVWGVFQRLKHFARLPFPWDEQELPQEKKGWVVVADWTEIMQKAKRLKDDGAVTIQTNTLNATEGTVEGDHGTYTTGFQRDDPESGAITLWHCSCPWGQVSWGRTRVWKKYEGRACSHLLALYWQAADQGTTPEEQTTIPGMEPQPVPEEAPFGTFDRAPAPTGPSIPGGPNQGVPSPPPAPVQPQLPAPEPTPPPQPSHQKTIQEVSPLELPGAFSNWRLSMFNNGDIIRAKIPLWGQDAEGGSYVVPAHMSGEVLYSDEEETIAIFPIESGPLGPHTVKVSDDTDYFYADNKAQPFIKKHR